MRFLHWCLLGLTSTVLAANKSDPLDIIRSLKFRGAKKVHLFAPMTWERIQTKENYRGPMAKCKGGSSQCKKIKARKQQEPGPLGMWRVLRRQPQELRVQNGDWVACVFWICAEILDTNGFVTIADVIETLWGFVKSDCWQVTDQSSFPCFTAIDH
jgi:hypothetical protein